MQRPSFQARCTAVDVIDTGPGVAADIEKKLLRAVHQQPCATRYRPRRHAANAAYSWAAMSALTRTTRAALVSALLIPAVPKPKQDGARQRILLVDDDQDFREAMSRQLSNWGHEVVACGSEKEANDRIDDRTANYDLAVFDMILKDSSDAENAGVRLTERMTARSQRAHYRPDGAREPGECGRVDGSRGLQLRAQGKNRTLAAER